MRVTNRYLIERFGGKVVYKDQLKELAEIFNVNSLDSWINYLITREYIVRIFRGLYYVKTFEEVFRGTYPEVYRLISMAMNKISAKWYFGLYTALRLNGLTHEFFTTIFVINDKIRRPKPINIAGQKVMFLKIREDLLDFGIKENNMLRFSDPEKTLLDFAYFALYSSKMRELYLKTFKENIPNVDLQKLENYARRYPNRIPSAVEALCEKSL